jgi:hypothetical protein
MQLLIRLGVLISAKVILPIISFFILTLNRIKIHRQQFPYIGQRQIQKRLFIGVLKDTNIVFEELSHQVLFLLVLMVRRHYHHNLEYLVPCIVAHSPIAHAVHQVDHIALRDVKVYSFRKINHQVVDDQQAVINRVFMHVVLILSLLQRPRVDTLVDVCVFDDVCDVAHELMGGADFWLYVGDVGEYTCC